MRLPGAPISAVAPPLFPAPFPFMPAYLSGLCRRSLRLFLTLLKVMLPVLIAVRVGEALGLVQLAGQALAPIMQVFNLPPEAGLVWMACLVAGIYAGLGALIGLAAVMDLTVAQLSALAAMMLFAHAIPVEQAIVRRAGASFWFTSALRVGTAALYGAAVSWLCAALDILQQPATLAWLQGSGAGERAAQDHLAWAQGTLVSLGTTYLIIVALLVLLDVFERIGLTRRITALMVPVLRVSGLEARVAPVTTVGVLLGLTYGGALIIEAAAREGYSPRTRLLALSWLSLSHSLIEDTLLMIALGADFWIVLVGRVLLTMLIVAGMARVWRQPAGQPLAGAG
ncbi:Hydroxymethylglutaryl-CoA reductase (NADPH) [plant metagenome]|uniref:Hydroxymethylglutaryl-CoA reductase (NADPH) n=1 Tax=plant metagenome TaxID=1297885 RepID=A0A484P3I9_9ZZZZ